MITIPQIEQLPFTGFLQRRTLPAEPGIYFALSESGEILYIGRAGNIAQRWAAHHRTKQLEKMNCAGIAWLKVSEASLLPQIEAALITHFQPTLNGTAQEGVSSSFDINYSRGTIGYFWNQVRETMRAQPRGYQTRLAQQLDVDKSYITRFIQGKHELAPKYHQAVLDSINLEIELKTKQGE